MTEHQPRERMGNHSGGESDTPQTVHLLVADDGNREAIRRMLEERFETETDEPLGEADLYLIEDELLETYHDELREISQRHHPVFCPVVVIARPYNSVEAWMSSPEHDHDVLLVDDVVEAPLERSVLLRRLSSLLIRRQQSLELQETVSELSEREQELRRFEQALQQTGNAIAITDPEGIIEVTNPAFENLTGYDDPDARGRSLSVIEAEADDTFTPVFWQTIRDRGQWDGEVAIGRTDGTRRITEAAVTTIEELPETGHSIDPEVEEVTSERTECDATPTVDGYVAVFTDITDRIRREEVLQRRESELALLKEILTRYLRHNIRNELNVIEGYADMLAETLSGPDAERAATIAATARELSKTSQTARQYSKLISQESTQDWLDLSEELPYIVDPIADKYGEVRIDLEVPESCRIVADARLLTAIEELVENAARHNRGDSQWIRVRAQSGEGIRIVVEDNGPGIPDEEIAALEQKSETALLHSSGVGLWLSKWAIESIGGELSFETDQTGTQAIIELPQRRPEMMDIETSSLTEREQRLRTLIDRMTDAIVEVNAEWEITFVEQQAEEIFGIDADQVRGTDFWEVFTQARETELGEVVRTAMEKRSSGHLEAHYPEIDEWLQTYVYPDFGGGLSLYIREVTERRQREAELRKRSQAMDAAPIGITLSEPGQEDNPLVYVNEAFERITGYSGTEIIGQDCRFLQGERTDDESVAELREAIEAREPVTVELRNYRKDGTMFWNRVSVAPVYDEDGNLSNFVGFQQDVTERKESERQLQERTRQLEGVLDSVDAAIWMRDPENQFLAVNQQFRDLFDLPDELDVAGKVPEEFLSEELATQFRENDRRVWEAQETVRFEETVATESGERMYLTRITPLLGEDGTPYATCGIATDITDQKRTERDLRERIRELDAFHRTAQLFAVEEASIETILEELVDNIPEWFQYPAITEASITYGDVEVATDGYEPLDRQLSVSTITDWGRELTISVVYREDRPSEDDGPFLAEERELLETALSFVHDHLGYHRSRRLYRTIADQFPNGAVFLYDTDLKYHIARGRGFDDIDTDPESLEGRRVEDVFDGEIRTRLVDLYESALDGEERSIDIEYEGHIYRVRAAPVRDKDGTIFAGLSMAEDVTQQ